MPDVLTATIALLYWQRTLFSWIQDFPCERAMSKVNMVTVRSREQVSIPTAVRRELDLEVIDDNPDDDKIIKSAAAGDVEYVVSGDSRLLDLNTHAGIAIHDPAQLSGKIQP
jgi:predicted nucleic acid-binding protein